MIPHPQDDSTDVDHPALEHLSHAARQTLYEEVRHRGSEFAELQETDFHGLQRIAADEGLEVLPGLGRQELLFEILKHRCTRTGLGWAEGVLEVLPDGFGFLRSPRHHYESGPDDIYVSPSQIRRLNLKPGHQVAGPVRPPKRGEKYLALLHVELVNGGSIAELRQRIPFEQRTPILPQRRLRLCGPGGPVELRMIELLSPWGFGQRVLLQAPPGSGRTLLLGRLVTGLLETNPGLTAVLSLVDERPEEVTDLHRRIQPAARREIVASTFDQPPSRHIALAETAIARALRIVEAGGDVLLVLDSLTALVRAFHHELPHSGKILTAGLDAVALQRPKRLFGAGRCLEEGGSLTVLATVLTGTGSRVDEVIAEEFAGKGNADLVLDRGLAELHVFPALDVLRTGTRREDSLLPPAAMAALRALRHRLSTLSPRDRLTHLEALLARCPDEDAVLRTLVAEAGANGRGG